MTILKFAILSLLLAAIAGCAVVVPRPGYGYYHPGWGYDRPAHVVIYGR